MRHLTVSSLGFLLAVLLISTTPIGTGAGTHQFDLLHPLFAHLHVVNGRVLSHEQMADQTSAEPLPTQGPTLGGGSGISPDGGGLGLSPTLPHVLAMVPLEPVSWTLAMNQRPPHGRVDAPPVPPPLT
jgi:hypothetical protein